MIVLNSDKAFATMQKYIKVEHLIKHSVATEICMRAYAQKFGEDVEYWGAVGVLHDVDFELYPEEHLLHTESILTKEGFDQEFIQNILSHDRKWDKPRTLIQKTLLAVDEMPGFVIACTLVRPDKDINNLQIKSVMKKFKDKAFARAVNRETMIASAADLGVKLEEHIDFIITALAQAQQPDKIYRINLFA